MNRHQSIQQVLAQGGKSLGVEHVAAADVLSPVDRYQELFVAVQSAGVFDDSKSFVDCIPRHDPAEILRCYRAFKSEPGFVLKAFVAEHFMHQPVTASDYVSDPNQSLREHIDGLWDVLTRRPIEHAGRSSLLPLPHEYVVPGGRFSEMYYWDSYFTMLGLAESGRPHLLRSMADNFAFLIDTYGHIPNGNRSYYLSRSQPPMFALMVELFEAHGIRRALHYLPQLRREYGYWMDGAESIAPGQAKGTVVCMPDGALLNRYWDQRDTPREEAYREDIATAQRSNRPAAEVYRDLRAGAASGWDYSSRWLEAGGDLSSIRTTAIVPIDLNSLLHKLETQIALLSHASGDVLCAEQFQQRAHARKQAIDRYLWNAAQGIFVDYDWQHQRQREQLTAAVVLPLYVGVASHEQAHRVGLAMQRRLLAKGGLATTELFSEQQWDQPNGWAPLQWMAIRGLRRYHQPQLAHEIAQRWLETVGNLYERESKLVEKYLLDVASDGKGGGSGGEYPLQDGFGWTNGVTRKLLDQHPGHRAHGCRAARPARRG
ncbi:MAG: alpha,alpha-trehalase TreF [Dyella sp.]